MQTLQVIPLPLPRFEFELKDASEMRVGYGSLFIVSFTNNLTEFALQFWTKQNSKPLLAALGI